MAAAPSNEVELCDSDHEAVGNYDDLFGEADEAQMPRDDIESEDDYGDLCLDSFCAKAEDGLASEGGPKATTRCDGSD